MKFRLSVLILMLCIYSIFAGGSNENSTPGSFSIGVFIPGQVEGSPTYEQLVAGVNTAAAVAEEDGVEVSVKILEGGYNQAEWGDKLQSLAATNSYDLIVSSNPAIPDLISGLSDQFPRQKFLVMDAINPGLAQLTTVMLNQYEQAYLSGYFAGLVTVSKDLKGINSDKIVGLLVGQEYPVMNEFIRPGFLQGLQDAAGSDAGIEYRVLGNWYDAEKARELSDSMIRQGADVILSISGGGGQGVISAAQAAGSYVLWYDSPGYSYAPGTVIGSSLVNLDTLSAELVAEAINGELEFGKTIYRGILENAVDYARDAAEYKQYVPLSIQQAMDDLVQSIQDGELVLNSNL